MKRTLYVVAAALLFSSLMVTCAGALQSLGEVARQQRETKRPSAARVYTNDDIAPSPQATAPVAAEKTDKAEAAAPAKAEDQAKLAAGFKSKIDEQKKTVAQLERELDVAQREYRLKVAVYYADAGNSLRDSKKWAEEDRKQKAELEGKQKALAEAKQKLADLEEQARKSGTRAE